MPLDFFGHTCVVLVEKAKKSEGNFHTLVVNTATVYCQPRRIPPTGSFFFFEFCNDSFR